MNNNYKKSTAVRTKSEAFICEGARLWCEIHSNSATIFKQFNFHIIGSGP